MVLRIYAALTIALACGLAGCSSSQNVQMAAALYEGDVMAISGSRDREASATKSSDVTGSIPSTAASNSSVSGTAEGSKVASRGTTPKSMPNSMPKPKLPGSEQARLAAPPKVAVRKLEEPLYRAPETQSAQLQGPASPLAAQNGSPAGPEKAVVLASANPTQRLDAAPLSLQSGSDRSGSLSLSYPTDAVELVEKDRRAVIDFATRHGSKDGSKGPITIVTGPSSGSNPLEGMLRVQERGRRLGQLLAAHGTVDVRFEPEMPRDSVRVD